MWLEFYFCCMVLACSSPSCHWIGCLTRQELAVVFGWTLSPHPSDRFSRDFWVLSILFLIPGSQGSTYAIVTNILPREWHELEVCGNSCIYMTFILLRKYGFGLSCGISEPDPTYTFCSCLFLGKDWARPALPLAGNSCLPIWILEGQTLYLDPEVPRSKRWDGCACSKDPAEPRNSLLKPLRLLMFSWQQMVQSEYLEVYL